MLNISKITKVLKKPFFPYIVLGLIISALYYKLFLFGKIPFPGDLMVGSYSPWFDYFKMPIQNPLISDVFSQFFLWKYLAVDSFKALQWPLWNPFSFTGTPLLATYHSAALYPLNILLFLPKYFGWGIFIFSQTLLAAVNLYLLLSLWTTSKLARLTGAVIFALGGLMATWLELGTAGHALLWLPLCFYAVIKYQLTSKIRFLLIFITSLSMLILAGNTQITTYSVLILFIFSLLNFKKTTLLPMIGSFILVIIITSLQLLPTVELFGKSIRISESYTGEFNYGLLTLKDSVKFFIPDFFGHPSTRNYWGFLNYPETSGFLGTLTLPLILFSYLYLRRNKVSLFFLILLPVTLILTFDNPISKSIYEGKIPLFTSSYASRMLFMTLFSASILSALSINQILKLSEFNKFLKTTIWSWAAILGIILGSYLTSEIIKEILKMPLESRSLEFYLKDRDFALSNFQTSFRNSMLPIGIISMFLIVFLFLKAIKFKIAKYSPLLIILTFFILLTLDLGRYFLKFNPFVSQKFVYPTTPALEFLQKQPGFFRVGREHAESFPPNTWIAYNIYSIEGYDPLYLNSYGEFINFLNGADIRTTGVSRYAELTDYKSSFLDTTNTKYFIGIGRDRNGYIPGDLIDYKFEEAKFERVFNDKSAVILKNPDALERVYFAKNFFVASQKEIEDKVVDDKSFDPKQTVALNSSLDIETVTGSGSATILEYTNNRVKIKTETENPEILILADQFDEGWKADIDGKDTKISRASLIFRAVKVPAGAHTVTFSYYPKSFDLGLKISSIGLLIFLLLGFNSLRRKTF